MVEKSSTDTIGAVVFDLDGTLTDTSEDIAFSINHFRHQQGLNALSTQEILKAVGRGASFLIQTLFEIEIGNDGTLKPLLEAFQRHYMAHQGARSMLYPGIELVLRDLATRYDLYILSNKPDAATKKEAVEKGITHYFRDIWGAGVFNELKPHPAGIKAALDKSKVPNTKCIMIGDLPIDIETGRNADVHTIFVEWGFGHLKKNDPRPSLTVNNAPTLADAIDRLMCRR
jgi:phosphoglycolate phosphatase